MKNFKINILFVALSFVSLFGYSQSNMPDEKLLQHVLLIQWSEGHDVKIKSEILSLFKGLPNKIDGLVSFDVQKVTASSGNYSNVLTFQFTSDEALDEYQNHPDHLKVKEIAPPLISGFAEYDYWK